MFNWFRKNPKPEKGVFSDTATPDFLASNGGGVSFAPAEFDVWDGDKFNGSFGSTQLQFVDYWTLRARSAQLFNENLYARGFIRRLVTNEIGTGLTPEAAPEEMVIGLAEDSLVDWTEDVETRFAVWGKTATVCDHNRLLTFGQIQQQMRIESLIEGDILVVLRHSQQTGMPSIQLIPGSRVRSPTGTFENLSSGHTIKEGVEVDKNGRHVAFHIVQEDGTTERLAATGSRSRRKLAWMVYGTDKRVEDTRGTPILSLIMQSVKEIDRYRDSTQRKATVNSFLAMFIKKGDDKMSTMPLSRGATKLDDVTVDNGNTPSRKLQVGKFAPGLVAQELQTNEEPVLLGGQGTDVNFGAFEESIIQAVAWANEVPPEILTMSFGSNYSASQAAINEFKIYLNKQWSKIGDNFCSPIYDDWLVSSTLKQRIDAPGLLDAWRDPAQWDVFGAWVQVDWYGSIKPSTDMVKCVKASNLLIEAGLSTRAREARINTGTKFSKNVKRLKKENELLVDANSPFLKAESEAVATVEKSGPTLSAVEDIVTEALENLEIG